MNEQEIHERLAVIETRVEALPDMRRDLAEIRRELANLRVRVGGVAAVVALLTSALVQIGVYFNK